MHTLISSLRDGSVWIELELLHLIHGGQSALIQHLAGTHLPLQHWELSKSQSNLDSQGLSDHPDGGLAKH